MFTPARALTIDENQRKRLRFLANSGKTPQKGALRARIVLLASEGVPHHGIARRRGARRATGLLWGGRVRGAVGARPAYGAAVAEPLPGPGRAGPAEGCAAAGPQEGHRARGGQAGGRGDVAHHTAGGDPLDDAHAGQGPGPLPHDRAPHLEAAWAAAAPGRDLQALARSPLCREAARRGGAVPRSAGPGLG